MDIRACGIGKAVDLDAFKAEIVRGFRVEHAIDKHDLQTVFLAENRCLVMVEHRRFGGADGVQRVGAGVFPIFVTTPRQAHLLHPCQRRTPRTISPAAVGQAQRRDAVGGCVRFALRQGHYATSDRISA